MIGSQHETSTRISATLTTVQQWLERAIADAAQRGAQAFEGKDSEEIDRQHDRLKRLKHAEALIDELLDLLSNETEPEDPVVFVLDDTPIAVPHIREPRHHERRALPSHPKNTWVPDLERAMQQSGKVLTLPKIYAAVEPLIRDRLLPGDLVPQKGHEPKLVWQYNIDWCMTDLHKKGKVVRVSSGRWQNADPRRNAGH